jgi:hypothetical protein
MIAPLHFRGSTAAHNMDTFPTVKHMGEGKVDGDYRTKRTILEIHDAPAAAIKMGKACRSRRNSAPAAPRPCHPPKLI